MGLIQLPQRHWTQPQYAAELDPLHWAFKDIVFAYSAGRGFTDGKHPKLAGTLTTFTTTKAGAKGKYLENTVPGNNAFFANHTDHDTLGGVTLIGLVQPSSVSGQMTVVSKDAAGGGTNTPLGLLLDSGAVSLNRANGGFRVWKGVATLAANQLAVVAATQGANIGTAPKFYIDGQFDTGTAVNLFGGSGSGAPIATSEGIKVSANTTFGNRFIGGIYGALVLNRECSAEEVAELSRNLWSIWKAPVRRIWAASTPGSSGTVAVTNADDTSSASGTTTVTGSSATTNTNDTSAASGSAGSVSGTVDVTNADDTSAASGTTSVVGASATTNAADTSSASGTTAVTGSSATTNADDTSNASGAVGDSVSGSVAYTNASDTSAASGTTTVTGTSSSTNSDDTSAASGTTTIVGSSAVTNADDVATASGIVGSVTGTVAYTNNNDTCKASGTSGIAVEVEDFGGDDAPIIIRKRKKKTLREQPNKHLEYILNKAVEEFQGVKPTTLKLNKNKSLEVKEVVSPDTPSVDSNSPEFEGFKTLEDAQKDAEKVAQLLAEYQQQVRAMEDDEDLIMLIAEFF